VDPIFASWPTIGIERYQLAGMRVVRAGHLVARRIAK
jgi:hypothetical protein